MCPAVYELCTARVCIMCTFVNVYEYSTFGFDHIFVGRGVGKVFKSGGGLKLIFINVGVVISVLSAPCFQML